LHGALLDAELLADVYINMTRGQDALLMAALPGIVDQALANGVDDLKLLTREQACAMEPQLECRAAVHSPSTGIVDSHGLMLSLQGDLENAGGMVVCHSTVQGLQYDGDAWVVHAEDGTALRANVVVNAAGLRACALGQRTEGLDPRHVPQPWYAKGSYFILAARSPFGQLVYPAPEPDKHLAGLGVHLTVDLGGQAKFGPDVQWVDDPEDLQVDPARGEAFYAEVRKYWPGLPDGALQPGYAGMRPKISGPHEAGRLPHRRASGARSAGAGQPVRHRIPRPDQLPGHRGTRGGFAQRAALSACAASRTRAGLCRSGRCRSAPRRHRRRSCSPRRHR
jgi:L-2-hydroxyglutarate oxidase LhgO